MVVTNTKLQRIVSRCGCEFYYASFDDELEEGLEAVPATNTVSEWENSLQKMNDNQWQNEPDSLVLLCKYCNAYNTVKKQAISEET